MVAPPPAGVNVYLDACCLNRPFDDQSQLRVRLESESILWLLNEVECGRWNWTSSHVLEWEISQTPDAARRERVLQTLQLATSVVATTDEILSKAARLQSLGFKAFDGLHLACAEQARCGVFLSTDDRLLRLSRRVADQLTVQVESPVDWVREVQAT